MDARRQGADGVELDVRRTADGALVLSHDPAIEGVGLVNDLSLADLPASIATLREALEVCAGLLVNVEIKNDPNEPGHDPTDALCAEVVAEVPAALIPVLARRVGPASAALVAPTRPSSAGVKSMPETWSDIAGFAGKATCISSRKSRPNCSA
jgi:hypothetical protein